MLVRSKPSQEHITEISWQGYGMLQEAVQEGLFAPLQHSSSFCTGHSHTCCFFGLSNFASPCIFLDMAPRDFFLFPRIKKPLQAGISKITMRRFSRWNVSWTTKMQSSRAKSSPSQSSLGKMCHIEGYICREGLTHHQVSWSQLDFFRGDN